MTHPMPTAEDKTMIEAMQEWPGSGSKRYCCVKNYILEPREAGGFPSMNSFGMLVTMDGSTFFNPPGKTGVTIFREYAEPITYASVDEMLAAGWMVD